MFGLIAKFTNAPKHASELMDSIFESQELFKFLHDDIQNKFVVEARDPRLYAVERVTKRAERLLRSLLRKIELPGIGKHRHSKNLLSRIKEVARMMSHTERRMRCSARRIV
jgi:hypothetical protein